MKLSELIRDNYFPYAKHTIVSRAIPAIDGFKPVQRRVLFAMNSMGLAAPNANKAKSVKIIGETMGKYHPHGDSSIYDALILMSKGYGGINVPYIDSKGSFGAVFSRDLEKAAPRYTEAKLAKVCTEFFEGLNENAVDFKDNFDSTEKEPTLLPVKFPNILVNSNSGVAVGTSSNIPSFSLRNVCLATQGILQNKITTTAELAKVLGAPEFTTGAYLHADEKSLEKLCATGKGTFTLTGHVEVYSNRIVITEIPYNTTAEAIEEAVLAAMKEGKLKGLKEIKDEIGFEGFRMVVEIKNGYSSREVLQELCRLTPLRTKISFRTRVIVDNRCKELNILELLNIWIDFRQDCIRRIYQFRLDKDLDKEHLLSTWEHIKDDILKVVDMISRNTDDVAKSKLITEYGLDEIQAEYLLDMKLRSITTNKAEKSLKELAEARARIKNGREIIDDIQKRYNIIVDELDDMIKKYGTDNKTELAPELKEEDLKAPEVKISDELTTVVLTRDGYLKRLTNTNDILNKYRADNGDEEVLRWAIKNNEYLLVFDRFGWIHKILVDDIDSSRGKLTDTLHGKAGLEKREDIIWADACGDYSKHFNIIYPNGKGMRVMYSKASGKRKEYKAGYDEVKPKQYWTTSEDKFFMLTKNDKATYCNAAPSHELMVNKVSFRLGRVTGSDHYTKLIPCSKMSNMSLIDISRYSKEYTVSYKNDMMWPDAENDEKAKAILERITKQASEAVKKETPIVEEEKESKEIKEQTEAKTQTSIVDEIDEMEFDF